MMRCQQWLQMLDTKKPTAGLYRSFSNKYLKCLGDFCFFQKMQENSLFSSSPSPQFALMIINAIFLPISATRSGPDVTMVPMVCIQPLGIAAPWQKSAPLLQQGAGHHSHSEQRDKTWLRMGGCSGSRRQKAEPHPCWFPLEDPEECLVWHWHQCQPWCHPSRWWEEPQPGLGSKLCFPQHLDKG